MPWEWDKSYGDTHVILPKLLRDLEAREGLEAEMEQSAETELTEKKPVVTKVQAAAEPSSFVPDKEILTNPDKPIQTKDQLATLMGADDSNLIEIVENK